jgi:Ala-tRNA(Pro) deacylase
MAVAASVQEFLRQSNVGYTVFPHPPAYTAQEEASVTHTSGWRWAKSVICFIDGDPVQAVVPAHYVVNLDRLATIAAADSIRMAHESELRWLFPDCEPGAMPPFGPLYKQRVFLDSSLAVEPTIAFNGGTHKDAIRMRVEDFIAIARPIVGRFGEPVVQGTLT